MVDYLKHLPGDLPSRLAPAVTNYDCEAMRQARNTCRQYLTGNTNEIDPEEQQLWWATLDHHTTRPFVMYVELRSNVGQHESVMDAPIGYGLVRRLELHHSIGNGWWVSGGLIPRARGKGYGKKLFGALTHLLNTDGKTAWLDVFNTNEPARRTYEALGYQVYDSVLGPPAVIVMRKPA